MGGKATGGRRVTLAEATVIVAKVREKFLPYCRYMRVAGSIRRALSEVGDVDFVMVPDVDQREEFDAVMVEMFGRQKNKKPKKRGLVDGVQVDVLISDMDGLGAALMHYTGPADLNIQHRAIAKGRGLLLNEKGLWEDDERLPCSADEREIYKHLRLKWLEPHERD